MPDEPIDEGKLEGQKLTYDDIRVIPGFEKINQKAHERQEDAIVRRKFSAGKAILNQDEHGTSAFHIVSGSAKVYVRVPSVRASKAEPVAQESWLRNLHRLPGYLKGVPVRRTSSAPGPADPADLGRLVEEVGPGDIVGELETLKTLKSILGNDRRSKYYPRAASVVATTDLVVLEMLPNYLNTIVFTLASFKEKLNQSYRKRAIEYTIRSAPVFQGLSEEMLKKLCAEADLVNFKPGETICKREDEVEFFDLIRLGFVKLSESFPGGELVLAYISRNSHFGEVGLMPAFRVFARSEEADKTAECFVSDTPVKVARSQSSPDAFAIPWDSYIARGHQADMFVQSNRLRVELRLGTNPIRFRGKDVTTAIVAAGESFVLGRTTFEVKGDTLAGRQQVTCTATDYVQLVRIRKEFFPKILEDSPSAAEAIGSVARGRRQMEAQLLRRVQPVSMSDFINQDLMQGQDVLLLDLDRCTRCDECVKACVATHTDGVTRLMRDGLRFQNYLVTTSCRACLDPLCMTRCPVGSIRRKGTTLDIVIESWCIGCNNCADDCPYGTINIVPLAKPAPGQPASPAPERRAVVCDLCKDYPEPNCVRACPQDAAIRVHPNFFFARDLAGVQLAAPPKPLVQVTTDAMEQTRLFSKLDVQNLTPRLRVEISAEDGDVLPAGHAQTFLLKVPGVTSFGRDSDNTWVLQSEGVSKRHAVIEWKEPVFVLRNLSATNGTYVNNDLAEGEVELQSNDLIEMGLVRMRFLVGRSQ